MQGIYKIEFHIKQLTKYIYSQSNNTQMAHNKTNAIEPEEYLKAYEKWGDDFVVIKVDNSTKDKSGMVTYYKTYIKLENGEEKPAYLKVSGLIICRCKSPSERMVNAIDIGPSYAFYSSSVGTNKKPIGKAALQFANSWYVQVESLQKKMNMRNKTINEFVTRTCKDASGNNQIQLEDPLIRIKFRTTNKNSNILAKPIHVAYSKDKMRTTAQDGSPFTTQNVHFDIKPASTIIGVIDFSSTLISQQGASNQASNELMIIKPSNGRGLNVKDIATSDELADLFENDDVPQNDTNMVQDTYEQDHMPTTHNANTLANVDPEMLGDDDDDKYVLPQ